MTIKWMDLQEQDRSFLEPVLGINAESIYEDYPIGARITLLNVCYLLKSERVAGNLWHQVKKILWAAPNQVGAEVTNAAIFKRMLEDSGNFKHDNKLTLKVKKASWSLRQVRLDGQAISTYGLQVYQRKNPSTPNELVLDIDRVVLLGLSSLIHHILDVLLPTADPQEARRELIARRLLPNRDDQSSA
ncbi:MAG: hypothetical protein RMM17_14025 [Acidobacteriota bacterium]|nr:hypothetical protein [Blastocatellia bacterium]MDW8413786.1 hypothetical protein [Acidobacteriota bacterium]